MNHALLMTATVRPPAGMTYLSRTDPELRMRDYCEALRFYLSVPSAPYRRVVLIDNSASDLTPLRAAADATRHDKEVEFVSFYGLDYPPAYGKGYGEFRLLDHGLGHAALLADLAPDDRLWKVTGRYRVLNIRRLIATAPDGYHVYGDLRTRPRWWFDLRVFSCSRAGYDRFFRGRYPTFREGPPEEGGPTAAEEAVAKALWPRRDDPHLRLMFRVEPLVAGAGGYGNRSLTGGKAFLRHLARCTARRLCPTLWFHGRQPGRG